ncbi:MAG: molecular chaperone DnaJ, partial [Synechococcaceae bacterium WB4_1_0192]|nr:molecular chaperone DnaJ [Synechococcaceae bacterium WB4_1_0192]
MSDRSHPLHLASQSRGGGGESQPCPRCGGSGQLRTGHGAYRTCLHCAGLGVLGV